MYPGLVTLILHAHAPYVRQPSLAANGEEPLHRLVIETYIPLLSGLYDLIQAECNVQIGLALSPILLEQLADRVVQKHINQTLHQLVEDAEQSISNSNDEHSNYLAKFYTQFYQQIEHIYERQWHRDIVGATRTLVEQSVIEPLMHTATHIVPHRHDRGVLRTQLQVGQLSISQHLGRRPQVMWSADEPIHPALITLLPPLNVHGIIGNPHQELYATLPVWINPERAMWVLPPNEQLINNIRNHALGYPGDDVYRSPDQEFANNGMRYDPYHAYERTRLHAKHFVAVLEQYHQQQTAEQPTIMCLALELELFGNGWFEGGVWLRNVIREIDRSPNLTLRGPAAALNEYPISRQIALTPSEPELQDGSLHSAGLRLREAIDRYRRLDADHEAILNQAARELLIAQSGDWDRWKSTLAAPYAQTRRTTHIAHVYDLLRLTASQKLDESQLKLLAALQEQTNPFPFIHYRLFADTKDTK